MSVDAKRVYWWGAEAMSIECRGFLVCKREALHLVYDQDGTFVYPGEGPRMDPAEQHSQAALSQ